MSISAPTDIANCNRWGKRNTGIYSDAGITPATQGQDVVQYNDQSGAGNHLTKASGQTMKYDAAHGLIVSEAGNSLNEYMNLPAGFAIDNQSFSIFFICEFNSVRTGLYAYGSFLANSQLTGFLDFANTLGALNRPWVYPQSATYGPIPFTNLCLFGVTSDGSNLKFYVNGVVVSGAAIGAGSTTGGTIFGSGTYPMMAGIAEDMMWTRAITALEVADLYTYSQGLGVIVSASATVQIVAACDSLGEGQGATLNRSWVRLLNYPTYLMRNASRSSTTLQAMISDAAQIDQLVMAGKTNVLVVFAGTNDITGGRTGAQAYGDLQTFCSGRRTAGYDKIVVCTMLPRGSSDTERTAYNSAIRNGFAGHTLDCDAVADFGADASIGTFGAQSGANYAGDGVHLNNTGYAIAAPIAQTAIDGVIVDTTPPTVAGTVTDSTTFTFAFSEAVTGFVLADYALSGGHTFSAAAGSGSSRTATITPAVTALETVTLSYTGTTTVDTATSPNLLATFSGAVVTNSSTLNVPGAPVLDAITGLEVGSTGINVEPTAPASDGGSAVLFYEFSHNIASAGFVVIGSLAAANLANHFLDQYVLTGLSVAIRVRCRNAVGWSAYSATRTATSQGPDVLPSSGQTRLSISIGIGI